METLKRIAEKKIFLFAFYFFLFLFIFSFNFTLPRDPDFGWHLRYGKEFWEKKAISTKDTFSHSFFGQPLLETEWLTEAIYYFLFKNFSFFGVAAFSGILTSLAFFFPLIFFRGSLFLKFFLSLLTLWSSYGIVMVGARPQTVSIFFFSLLSVLLFKYQEKKAVKYLLPLPFLFLIWANAHPGFFLGLIFFGIYFLADWILGERKFVFLAVFFFCFLAVNLRPKVASGGFSWDLIKGLSLPLEWALQASEAGKVRRSIAEWLPPTLNNFSGSLFFLSIICSVALLTLEKATKKTWFCLFLLFFAIYFSLLSRRNTVFFFLVFLPLALLLFQEIRFFPDRPWFSWLNFFAFFLLFFWTPARLISRFQDLARNGKNLDAYCQAVGYPCQAIEFLRKEKPKGKMFNFYSWGGYLIWQLPEYPVFIDGRVPGGKIFAEYEKVVGLKEDWQAILRKYQIGWLFLPPNESFAYLITHLDGWEKIYEDEKAMVMVKK